MDTCNLNNGITEATDDPWDWDITPSPEETEQPEETENPHATQPPKGSGEKVTLENVRIELDPITEDSPSYIAMTIYNDTEDDLIIKSGAYVTTDGVDYDAMLSSDVEEDVCTIEADCSRYIDYWTADYMLNGLDCERWDFPINKASTFTFCFTIGGENYQAVINLADGTYTFEQ